MQNQQQLSLPSSAMREGIRALNQSPSQQTITLGDNKYRQVDYVSDNDLLDNAHKMAKNHQSHGFLPDINRLNQGEGENGQAYLQTEHQDLQHQYGLHAGIYSTLQNPQQMDYNVIPYTQRLDENGLNMMNVGVMGHRKKLAIKKRKNTHHAIDTKQSFNHLNYTHGDTKSDENTQDAQHIQNVPRIVMNRVNIEMGENGRVTNHSMMKAGGPATKTNT